jgi:hypothetical protein
MSSELDYELLLQAEFGKEESDQLLELFAKLVSRYKLSDWEPSVFNAGKFCEALVAGLYNYDSGSTNGGKRSYGDNISYLKNKEGARLHKLSKSNRRWLVDVVNITKGFRDDRGVAHISTIYNTNHLDSHYVLNNIKWLLAETLRIVAAQNNPDSIESFIESLIQIDVPYVDVIAGDWVINKEVSLTDEILILLLKSTPEGLQKQKLFKSLNHRHISSVRKIIPQILKKRLIHIVGEKIYLTSSGSLRVQNLLIERKHGKKWS